MVIVIVCGKQVTRVVGCYAPQDGCGEEEKDRFYNALRQEMAVKGPKQFLTVASDFNGHIGEGIDGYEGIHGGFSVGVRNCEGRRLLECKELYI